MTAAALSLTVDSSKVTTAHAELDRLTSAAQRSAKAVDSLEASGKKAGTAAEALQKQTGLARHELINLSRQAQDVGVSLFSGQSPFTVLVQQGTQIADVFSSSQGTVRGFMSQAASALTPTRLLAGGVGLLATAAGMLGVSVARGEQALARLSDRAGVATETMRALQQVAGGRGIGTDDFTAGMEKFSATSNEARKGLGEMASLFRANGVQVGSLNENLLRGADLIRNAATEEDKYRLAQAMGLPPTREWVKLLSQGSDGIKQATADGVRYNESAAAELAKSAEKFDHAWDTAWTSFKNYAKSGTLSAGSWIASLIPSRDAIVRAISPNDTGALTRNLLKISGSQLSADEADSFYSKTGALAKGSRTIDQNERATQIAREQQYIGVLGATASISDQVRSKELDIQSARLAGVQVTQSAEAAILDYTRAQANGTMQLRQQTDAQTIETAAVGMATGAAAAYRAEQALLADFKRRGITLESQDAAAVRETAKALGEATQAAALRRVQSDIGFERSMLGLSDAEQQVAQKMRTLYGDAWQSQMQSFEAEQLRVNASLLEAKNNAQAFASGFVNDIMNGKDAVDALANSLKRLASSWVDKGINSLLSSWMGTTSLSSGTVTTSLRPFGIAHTGGVVGQDPLAQRLGDPSWFAGANRFSKGGIAGLGPDEVPIIAHRKEEIIRADDPRHRNNGGGTSISMPFAPVINVSGSGSASDSAATVRAVLTEFAKNELYPHVVRVVNDAKSRGHISQ